MVGKNGRKCPGRKMIGAVAPYGVHVDIRDPQTFALWRSRRGLLCKLCSDHAQPYHRQDTGNRYLRHGRCDPVTPKTGRDRGKQTLLRYWLHDRLLEFGLTGVTARPYGDKRYPHVRGARDERRYAVMVQYDPLPFGGARQRTNELIEAGYDQVLWLTRHCDWVERLPSLGISEFTQGPADDYHLHTGFLVRQANTQGLNVQCYSLRDFLRQWTEPDTLAWAHLTTTTAGWAAVTDWKQLTLEHLRTIEAQNERIRQLDQQLAVMRQELEEASHAGDTGRRGADDRDERRRRIPLEAAYGAVVALENRQKEPPADLESEPDAGLSAAVQELQHGKNRNPAPIDARLTAAVGRMTILRRMSAALVALCLILALLAWLTSRKAREPMRA